MPVLVDTNILVRALQPHHPHCSIAERAIAALRTGNEALHVTVQNLTELWAVATRPAGENGLGLTTEAALKEVIAVKRFFSLLPETVPLLETWEDLVASYRVAGRNTYDARLVAAMKMHGLNRILTFNVQDFARYAGIEIIDPQAV